MPKDRQIIEQIEGKIDSRLEELNLKFAFGISNSYAVDKKKNVIGLNLHLPGINDYSFIKDLKHLTHLRLVSNGISDISFISDLQNLVRVDLSSNAITDAGPLGKLTLVTELNLKKNQVADISFLKELKNLTKLELAENNISDISPLNHLMDLTYLDLNNNKISGVGNIPELKKLANLYLMDNQISDLSFILELKKLSRVDLRNNEITQLPKSIVDRGMRINWKKGLFGGLILEGNPLEKPPIEIIEKGTDVLKAYFKSIEGEKQALNEVKVLLVGDGGSGKTSLMKRLLGQEVLADEAQTHGIDIDKWEVRAGNDKIRVNIWDFGGRDVMHATHQFFFSKRSLYILVLDSDQEEKTEYWLKHIRCFGGESPVVVVMNKADINPSFDINRLFLKEKYPNIKGFFKVSCLTNDGIEHFAKCLIEDLSKVELIRTTWGESWFNVKTSLENLTSDFINYEEYRELCVKEKITDSITQDTLVDYLNDLGVVVRFRDLKLEEAHVMEPEWVTTALYKIINSPLVAENHGELKFSQLEEILKKESEGDYYYPPDKHKYIIDLMSKFELCYNAGNDTMLIPDLLEIQQPEFEFDYSTALQFQMQYDFLPKSIMSWFIVKMHSDVKDGLIWRTGVVLEDKVFGSTAVVKADNEARHIYIYVQGERRKYYFAAVLLALRVINSAFEKLDVVEKIPMPDAQGVTVSYQHLVRLDNKGIATYIPDGAEKEYKVKALLDAILGDNRDEEIIMKILAKMKEDTDTEATLLEKVNRCAFIQPGIVGIGIDLKWLIKKLFAKA